MQREVQGVFVCAIAEWRQLDAPQRDSTLCQPLYFCYTLYDPLYPSEPGHIKISSQKMQKQSSLLQAHAHFPSFGGGYVG